MHGLRMLLSILLAVLLLSACAAPAKKSRKPGWVDGVSEAYPADVYLLGRGQAASRDDAQDRSRTDLAKIFEVTVSEESRDFQSFTSLSTAEGTETENTTAASRNIMTHTERVL
ncbi:MAG: LPP20 family lipoprotein, partial [Gammaproteobacteria bacterium]|nr:LPP20 family lipoprotein [Gammaproteobacteria bacterium]